ncbi:MAG: hypothetical protein JW737_04915 [Acidobacteria bacterium]|nr:hypothetical protein [Acidobacteriota bacterium]
MKTERAIKLIPLYLTGDLNHKKKLEFEKLLPTDEKLNREIEKAREIFGMISSIESPVPRRQFEQALVRTVMTASSHRSVFSFKLITVAASVIFLLVAGFTFFLTQRPGRIEQTQEWLVNNINKIENINGYSSYLSIDYISDEKLQDVHSQIKESLPLENASLSIYSSSGFDWEFYLEDEDVSKKVLDNYL